MNERIIVTAGQSVDRSCIESCHITSNIAPELRETALGAAAAAGVVINCSGKAYSGDPACRLSELAKCVLMNRPSSNPGPDAALNEQAHAAVRKVIYEQSAPAADML